MARVTRPLALAVANQQHGFKPRVRGETLGGPRATSAAGLGLNARGHVRREIAKPPGSPIAIARANKLAAYAPRFAQKHLLSGGQGRVGRRPYRNF